MRTPHIAVLASLLAGLAACSGREPPPGVIELLDRRWDRLDWPRELPEAPRPGPAPMHEAWSRSAGVRLAMRLGDQGFDHRTALLAPSGTRFAYDLDLPRDPVLHTSLGWSVPDGAAPVPVRFLASVIGSNGVRHRLVDLTFPADPRAPWHDVELSLRRWSRRRIRLELETAAPGGGPAVWAAWAGPRMASAGMEPSRFDVLLVVLDTLRADRLSAAGYERPTTPWLDDFARRATRFGVAIAAAPWTQPSHRALFTGLYPQARAAPIATPLARAFADAGWRTLALTGGGQIDPAFGFATGFDVYQVGDWVHDPPPRPPWLEAHDGQALFTFLHTYEPHDPYHHLDFAAGLPLGRLEGYFSKSAWDRFRHELTVDERCFVSALYDGNVRHADLALGEVLASLAAAGRLDRTIVVVTSDHGEQFWEHGTWRHGQNVYDHQIRVPLVIRVPPALSSAGHGRVVSRQVRLIDLYPTLLDLVGLQPDHPLAGRSLRPLLEGRDLPPADAFAEGTSFGPERKALRTERLKLVANYPSRQHRGREPASYELYDLGADPAEQHDLAGERRLDLLNFARSLRAFAAGERAEAAVESAGGVVDPELRERLRALGYVAE